MDADVIVPAKLLEKDQYSAYVMRPRLQMRIEEYLVPAANTKAKVLWKQPANVKSLAIGVDLTEGWRIDRSVQPLSQWKGGTRQALRLLKDFVQHKLAHYSRERNHPELEGTSSLSPYLHFGHIGPITVALAVEKADVPRAQKDAFLNQLLTWRELAINLVHFNPDYDSFECAEPWAHRTLAQHARDPRPVVYTEAQLENGETHDSLWNAAQMQMVNGGWMHNYLRMYWAKKILEWSSSPAMAHQMV